MRAEGGSSSAGNRSSQRRSTRPKDLGTTPWRSGVAARRRTGACARIPVSARPGRSKQLVRRHATHSLVASDHRELCPCTDPPTEQRRPRVGAHHLGAPAQPRRRLGKGPSSARLMRRRRREGSRFASRYPTRPTRGPCASLPQATRRRVSCWPFRSEPAAPQVALADHRCGATGKAGKRLQKKTPITLAQRVCRTKSARGCVRYGRRCSRLTMAMARLSRLTLRAHSEVQYVSRYFRPRVLPSACNAPSRISSLSSLRAVAVEVCSSRAASALVMAP